MSLQPDLPGIDSGIVAAMDAILAEKDMHISVKETSTGSFLFGVGVSSDVGLAGSIVMNERNFDVDYRFCRDAILPYIRALFLPPLPPEGNEGCLVMGLSLPSGVNLFCRTPCGGTMYNVLYANGLFAVWASPEVKVAR